VHAFPVRAAANLVKSTLFSCIKAPILAVLSTLLSGQTVCAGEIRAFKRRCATCRRRVRKPRPSGLFSIPNHRQYYVREGIKEMVFNVHLAWARMDGSEFGRLRRTRWPQSGDAESYSRSPRRSLRDMKLERAATVENSWLRRSISTSDPPATLDRNSSIGQVIVRSWRSRWKPRRLIFLRSPTTSVYRSN
jgi:hypothetical protein